MWDGLLFCLDRRWQPCKVVARSRPRTRRIQGHGGFHRHVGGPSSCSYPILNWEDLKDTHPLGMFSCRMIEALHHGPLLFQNIPARLCLLASEIAKSDANVLNTKCMWVFC